MGKGGANCRLTGGGIEITSWCLSKLCVDGLLIKKKKKTNRVWIPVPILSLLSSMTLAQTLEFPRTYFPCVNGHRKTSYTHGFICLKGNSRPKVIEDSNMLYKYREQSF